MSKYIFAKTMRNTSLEVDRTIISLSTNLVKCEIKAPDTNQLNLLVGVNLDPIG